MVDTSAQRGYYPITTPSRQLETLPIRFSEPLPCVDADLPYYATHEGDWFGDETESPRVWPPFYDSYLRRTSQRNVGSPLSTLTGHQIQFYREAAGQLIIIIMRPRTDLLSIHRRYEF